MADNTAGMSKAELKAAADKAAAAAAASSANKRFQQTQAQVDEVVDIMRMNVDKVLERDSKLSALDDRADALQMGASQFEQSAGALKRKFWWKNLKMAIILGLVIVTLAIVAIVWIYSNVKKEQAAGPPPGYYPPPQMIPQPTAGPEVSTTVPPGNE